MYLTLQINDYHLLYRFRQFTLDCVILLCKNFCGCTLSLWLNLLNHAEKKFGKQPDFSKTLLVQWKVEQSTTSPYFRFPKQEGNLSSPLRHKLVYFQWFIWKVGAHRSNSSTIFCEVYLAGLLGISLWNSKSSCILWEQSDSSSYCTSGRNVSAFYFQQGEIFRIVISLHGTVCWYLQFFFF